MTKKKILATVSAGAMVLGLSTSASFAAYFVPGETMGVSLVSPVPEGVFFADLETYGRSDKVAAGPDANFGVNIPLIIWSTPFTFYNTRLEIFAAFPFAHIDNGAAAGVSDRIGAATYALGPAFAHDFGGGLTGGLAFLVRTPDPSQNIQAVVGHTTTEMDVRQSLQYFAPNLLGGLTFIENAGFSSALGQPAYNRQNDMFAGDFTIEKTIDKFTFGVTGFGNIDTDNRVAPHITLQGLKPSKQASVEVGGLIGYDFGRFSVTAIVTRSVYVNSAGIGDTLAGNVSGNGYETRGWFHVVVPLYIAQPAPRPVVARY